MEEYAVQIATLGEKISNIDKRIKTLEETIKRIESLTLSVEKLAMAVENMAKEQVDYRSKQNELAKRLLEVEQAPFKTKANTYNTITKQIMLIILGAVVGYLLKSFFGL